jgi:hypothetical protein
LPPSIQASITHPDTHNPFNQLFIMALPRFALLTSLLLAAYTVAVDICFFEISNNCDTSQTHLCCNNFPSDRCCFDIGNGFCIETAVFGLEEESEQADEGLTFQFFENNDCTAPRTGSCNDDDCCAFLGLAGDDNSCSGEWIVDSEEAKKKKKKPKVKKPRGTTPGENCDDPNFAHYATPNGTSKGIHIPKGSLDQVLHLLRAKDYEGLAAFEDWNDQKDYE